jgi:hypothetical protein
VNHYISVLHARCLLNSLFSGFDSTHMTDGLSCDSVTLTLTLSVTVSQQAMLNACSSRSHPQKSEHGGHDGLTVTVSVRL